MTAAPATILTRERLYNMPLAEVQQLCAARLGQPNAIEVQGHAPGTLRAKSWGADGGTERWRILIEWEPIAILQGVFQ